MALTLLVALLVSNVIVCWAGEHPPPLFPGACPKFEAVPDFDESKLLGEWCAAYHSNSGLNWLHSADGRIEKLEDGRLRAAYEMHNSTARVTKVDITLIRNNDVAGLYDHSLEKDGKNVNVQHLMYPREGLILDWTCCEHNEDGQHREAAFILSRGVDVPEEDLKFFQKFLSDRGSSIPASDFVRVPELNCRSGH